MSYLKNLIKQFLNIKKYNKNTLKEKMPFKNHPFKTEMTSVILLL